MFEYFVLVLFVCFFVFLLILSRDVLSQFPLSDEKNKTNQQILKNLHLVTIPSQQTRFPKFLADNVLGETCFDPKLNKKRNF